MKDISTKEDISLLVNDFYGKVLKNESLAPFFQKLDFEKHMPKMEHFWAFVLLDEANYTTNVIAKHLHMPIEQEHFDTWLQLFGETVDEHFSGEKANMAKERAKLIALTIQYKLPGNSKV
ncbi:MAG: group III truncated hemoglobin [Bacteroidetes bacterium]|nr:MAG: group III truncated hemoglobin [Bacteroidota bacterium]